MNDRLITDPAFFVRVQKTKLALCFAGLGAVALIGEPYVALAGIGMLSVGLLLAYAFDRLFRVVDGTSRNA